jgi:hypothetical protein
VTIIATTSSHSGIIENHPASASFIESIKRIAADYQE